MKITAQVPASLSWHQCIGCLEEMARKMEKDDLERISIHDAKRLGALVGFVETVVQHREQLAIQEANEDKSPTGEESGESANVTIPLFSRSTASESWPWHWKSIILTC